MINATISDCGGDLRDPFEVLAEMATKMRIAPNGDAEHAGDAPADIDPHETEAAAKETLWRALCISAGLPTSGSDRVMWRLYTLGALETAVIWLYEKGYFAPFAWPQESVALMLTNPLSEWNEMSAEEIANNTFFESARTSAFQESGWIIVQVDPNSSTLDEQLARIVDLVLGSEDDADVQS